MIKAKDMKEGYVYLSTTDENFMFVIEYKKIKGINVELSSWIDVNGDTMVAEHFWHRDGYVAAVEIGKL